MRAYSMDLRVRVLAAVDAGDTTAEVAETFAVSPAWVRRLVQRRRDHGEVGPRARRSGRPPTLRDHADRIRAALAIAPDLTPTELRDELRVAVALSTLWAAVRALGYTFKKSSAGRRAGPGRRAGGPRPLAGRRGPGPGPEPGRVRR